MSRKYIVTDKKNVGKLKSYVIGRCDDGKVAMHLFGPVVNSFEGDFEEVSADEVASRIISDKPKKKQKKKEVIAPEPELQNFLSEENSSE